MIYATLSIFTFILLVALLWDMWIPSTEVSVRRPGAIGVALAILFSSAALIALLLSAPHSFIAVPLALSLLSCILPLSKVMSFAKTERHNAKKIPKKILQRESELPSSLVDADNALKLRYDDLSRKFGASFFIDADPTLIEHGRLLAEELSKAAKELGYSRAYEMSKDIPALIYWAADIARRSYPEGHESQLAHEHSLRYYENFETTAWLWERYISKTGVISK